MRARVLNGVVYSIEPTTRQRKSAKALSDALRTGKHVTKGEIVLAGDYSKSMSKKPLLVTESKGFLVALAELGLTKELVVSALAEDIKAKPQRRAFELSIAGKWLGLEKKEETSAVTNNIQNAVIMISPPKEGLVKPDNI